MGVVKVVHIPKEGDHTTSLTGLTCHDGKIDTMGECQRGNADTGAVAELPMIYNLIHKQINSAISNAVVLPNCISVPGPEGF